MWRDILSSQKALLKGICYKIGNGVTIRPWSDPWVPGTLNYVPRTKERVDESTITCVVQLRSIEGVGWNMDFLNRFCDAKTMDLIKKIKWSIGVTHDKLLWKGSTGKSFSMRECYEMAHQHRFNLEHRGLSKMLWKAKRQ